ncbi:hypothetical protein [Terrarubrum flagellatum]|uniref:hypothetical protein n=1 Tax=Terrirubrum flagellatum TaxID=2895980 RepID=UPI003145301E
MTNGQQLSVNDQRTFELLCMASWLEDVGIAMDLEMAIRTGATAIDMFELHRREIMPKGVPDGPVWKRFKQAVDKTCSALRARPNLRVVK